jgi:hypothetical protein
MSMMALIRGNDFAILVNKALLGVPVGNPGSNSLASRWNASRIVATSLGVAYKLPASACR